METTKIISTPTAVSIVITNSKQRFFVFSFIVLIIIFMVYFKIETSGELDTNIRTVVDIEKVQATYMRRSYVLSYCIFGTKKKWAKRIGNVAAEVSKSRLYFNWTIRIYHDGSFNKKLYKKYYRKKYNNVLFYDVRKMPRIGDVSSLNAMIWRFLPLNDQSVDVTCSRDLDSPILKREEAAVEEWLRSGKLMHVMRDHKKHSALILGGLWCYRNRKDRKRARTIARLILDHATVRTLKKEAKLGDDQIMLKKYVWPLVKNDTLQHDSYLCKRYVGSVPYPIKREDNHSFVGCKRVCKYELEECPEVCRPAEHKDWLYC